MQGRAGHTVNGEADARGSRLQKGRFNTGAATWRHADFRKHREHWANGGGRWVRVLWQDDRTHDGTE